MVLVLALVVVALAMSVYLSITRSGFGAALTGCLLGPAIVIFLCVAFLLFGLPPDRPSLIPEIGAVVVVATFVVFFPFVTAAVRLVRVPTLRTRRNVITFVIAGLSLLPAIGTFLGDLVDAG
jgi:hypothetical protein